MASQTQAPTPQLAAASSLQTTLDQISAFDPEKLLRPDLRPLEIDFQGCAFHVRELQRLAGELNVADYVRVAPGAIAAIQAAGTSALQALTNIQKFAPNNFGSRAQEYANTIQGEVSSAYDRMFAASAQVLAYTGTNTSWVRKSEMDAISKLNKMEQIQLEFQIKQTELNKILDNVRNLSAEIGVAHRAAYFENEAKEHGNASRKWLWATITAVLVTVGAAAFNYYEARGLMQSSLSGNTVAASGEARVPLTVIAQFSFAKLIVFSILFSAVLWIGRIYRSHRHNYIVNKHRANALKCFELFAGTTVDPQTKNAILLASTQCIFAPQQTGYTGQSQETDAHPKILEVFRSLTEVGNK